MIYKLTKPVYEIIHRNSVSRNSVHLPFKIKDITDDYEVIVIPNPELINDH